MTRERVWIENQNFHGFGCSDCNWTFRPLGPLVGISLDVMRQKFEAELEKEFAAHVCTMRPKGHELKG
jgi:hypothetical protein